MGIFRVCNSIACFKLFYYSLLLSDYSIEGISWEHLEVVNFKMIRPENDDQFG